MRLVFLERCPVVGPLDEVDRVGGLEQMGIVARDGVAQLSEGADVVNHPEPAAVRRNYQIVAVDLEVAHRRHRQVELERLPVVSIIERDVHSTLGAGDQKPAAPWILLHRVHVHAGRQTLCDLLPGLAYVARAIDVRLEILELVTVDTRVSRVRIEVRSLHHRHSAPRRDRARRHVLPGLPVVASELQVPVVRTDP